jgi:glycosyltransferase involved in cell wall biosynthesis
MKKTAGLGQIISDGSYESPWTTMSIIIPTYNSGYLLSSTLESVFAQQYSDFEVIIIDANSQDNTLEIINRFRKGMEKVYSVAEYNFYDMLNHGLSLAQGFYISFLLPGDTYISMHALTHMAHVITDSHHPDLAYCGSFFDEGRDEPSVILEQMLDRKLRQGKKPSILQACWVKKESIQKINGFDGNYIKEGDFDLLCRLYKKEDYKFVATNRILVDDSRRKSKKTSLREMWSIIRKYFGFLYALRWLLGQRPSRILRNMLRGMRHSFLGD